MNLWKEITKLALIGTERGQLSEKVKVELQKYGIDTAVDSAEVVLKASALLSKIKRAGYQPKENSIKLPAQAPAETQDLCSPKSVQHLNLVLSSSYKDALPEFLKILEKVGKRLPAEVLPDILEMGKKKQKDWDLLRKIIGARGEWLVQQNPEWQYIALNHEVENWETGSKQQRLAILRYWRKTDAKQGLALLESTWKTESVSDKVDFLNALSINLSIDDEAFLEKSLDAKRKEERKTAAKLLAKIANSQLVKRMFNRVKLFIELDGSNFQISLPDKVNEEMSRDGINPNSQWIKGGVKASRLGQMLAIVPPKRMESHFTKAPKEILHLYWKSEWRELLFQATMESTALHNDEDWSDAIFTFWMENATNYDLSEFININPLLENITESLFNKIAIMGLTNAKTLLPENHPVIHLLRLSPYPWQPALTKALIKNLQIWMQTVSTHWSGWHYKGILKKSGFHSNPDLVNQFEIGWPKEQRVWGTWEKEVDEFLGILRFRKTMIEELKK